MTRFPRRILLIALALLLFAALLLSRDLFAPGSSPESPEPPGAVATGTAPSPGEPGVRPPPKPGEPRPGPGVRPPPKPGEPGSGTAGPRPRKEGDEPDPGKEPALPPGFFPNFHGTIVDMDTGEPIPGARIEYGPLPYWRGAHAGADGTFSLQNGTTTPDPTVAWSVRVYAPGYETLVVQPREAEVRLELRPRSGPPAYGRIRGRAEDKSGAALAGALSLYLREDEGREHWLTVFADNSGAFTLEGIDPGGCRVSLEHGPIESVFVPEGGAAEIVLRAKKTREELRRPISKAETARLEKLRREFQEQEIRVHELQLKDTTETERQAAQERMLRLADSVQALESRGERVQKRFPVTITGLGGKDGARLVAEFWGSASIERWWAVIRNGRARFPGLLAGEWHLILREKSGETKRTVKVATDGGPVTVRFAAD